MDDDRAFIKDVQLILQSSIDVEDWVTIKELIQEISDYLGELDEEDDDYLDS
jgi:hypothetical protein